MPSVAAPNELPLALTPEQVEAAEASAQETAPPGGYTRIEEADAAWFAGHRAEAVKAWRQELDSLAGNEHDLDAQEVMLRVRLLPLSGNLGPLWLEGTLTAAVARCEEAASDWCRVAEADYDLWMPRIAGADPRRVAADLASLQGWAPADERIERAKVAEFANPEFSHSGDGSLLAPLEMAQLVAAARAGLVPGALQALIGHRRLGLEREIPEAAMQVQLIALGLAGLALLGVGGSFFAAYYRGVVS